MPRMLWLGLGFLAGMAVASRHVHETRLDVAPARRRGQGRPPERETASTTYGAGTASLGGTETPLGSKAYPAGTASLPMDEQEIRNPDTIR